MLTSVFVLVNGILVNRSNGLMIKCLMYMLNSMFDDELKEVKYFKQITDFKVVISRSLKKDKVWRVSKSFQKFL